MIYNDKFLICSLTACKITILELLWWNNKCLCSSFVLVFMRLQFLFLQGTVSATILTGLRIRVKLIRIRIVKKNNRVRSCPTKTNPDPTWIRFRIQSLRKNWIRISLQKSTRIRPLRKNRTFRQKETGSRSDNRKRNRTRPLRKKTWIIPNFELIKVTFFSFYMYNSHCNWYINTVDIGKKILKNSEGF